MKFSQLFTKTHKEAPKDETAASAQLLLRGGFMYKQMAGAYVLLPLGLRVLNKIIGIIREEMEAAGGVELAMTALQPKEPWLASGRWDDQVVDVWFKTKLHNGTEVGLGNTHEEPLTALMREYVSSYRDLPRYVYQFQTKFRNELRAKSGIMRTREFIMKDLYSFSRTQAEHDAFYDQMKAAYTKIFKRVGIGDHTYLTFASGGSFAKFSHEFQTVTNAGEDTIYLDKDKKIAINEEVYTDEVVAELDLKKDQLQKVAAAEVGNIFTLGTKYSDALDLKFTDEDGSVKPVVMGSYGIGPARTMGVIVELMHDDRGIVWPAAVAPAQVHLVRLGDDKQVIAAADKLYANLQKQHIEVLYDDRDESAGAKFADADLIGCPIRLTVSAKTLDQQSVELKRRTQEETKLIPLAEAAAACVK
ncbi:MAG TPA: aminoacyl--tRNA ligase-related protein [Candidatus Saccharimonadales bacterium]|nr:aminoacyl--tRNA ligase-related protein [Candidatus Saccharimonadales bacterium]